jgi:hypothetical protein
LLFFGSLLFLGALGGASIDAKRIRALGREVSRVQVRDLQRPLRRHPPRPPAAAPWRDGLAPPVALLVYAGLFAAHPLFAGVSAAG